MIHPGRWRVQRAAGKRGKALQFALIFLLVAEFLQGLILREALRVISERHRSAPFNLAREGMNDVPELTKAFEAVCIAR